MEVTVNKKKSTGQEENGRDRRYFAVGVDFSCNNYISEESAMYI